MNRIEAFFRKEMTEKAGRIAIFSLFLLIPFYQARIFFLFLLAVNMLPWDIKRSRFSSLMAMPYSYNQLFWISYFMMIIINITTFVVGGALGAGIFAISLQQLTMGLIGSLIFSTAYYAISMLCVTAGLDNFGVPFLIFIADMIIGGIGYRGTNPYFYISPANCGNAYFAGSFAIALLIIAAYLFNKKGVTK